MLITKFGKWVWNLLPPLAQRLVRVSSNTQPRRVGPHSFTEPHKRHNSALLNFEFTLDLNFFKWRSFLAATVKMTSRIIYSSKYLLLLTLLAHRVPAGMQPDLFKNQLHFGYGINYKYNGQLYHNFDRVWVVHRVVIPNAADLDRLPDFPDPVECYPNLRGLKIGSQEFLKRKLFNGKICDITKPHLELLAKQASYYKTQVSKYETGCKLCRAWYKSSLTNFDTWVL